MAKYTTDQIRNTALIGHGGAGKTTLADAMLFKAGALNRIGSVREKNTTSDFTPEEKEAGYSMHLAWMHCDYKDKRINILDCPGYADFVVGAYQGIAVCDTAVLCIHGASGIQINTRKMWEISQGKGRIIAVTRMDLPQASFSKIVEQVRQTFGAVCVPIAWPKGGDGGETFAGADNLLEAANLPPEAQQAKQNLIENALMANEELMMLYLDGKEIPPDEINKAVKNAILTGTLVPIVPVASEKNAAGVDTLLDVIAGMTPSPADIKTVAVEGEGDTAKEVEIKVDENAPFMAQVYRVKGDTHLRKLTYFRVYSGKFDAGGSLKSVGDSKGERIQQILIFQGGKHTDIPQCIPGDIAALSKIESFSTNDTLVTGSETAKFKPLKFPIPMVRLAIEAKNRNDAAKCSEKLRDFENEDPTFIGRYDPSTKELVISGIGSLHLDSKLKALKSVGVEVNTRLPKIPYKETITANANVSYRHKKQTGGSGQFAEVHIKVEPNERGAGFEFVDEIVGGVITGPFIQSTERGIRAKLEEGIVAGYPVVDLKVRLYYGKMHPVDSKDIAFQIAGREAIKKGVREARPVLLEPIVKLEVTVPQPQMGDITGLISGKRGAPSGLDALGDMVVVKALVPLAELQNFSSELKSITGGAGSYSIELSHYAPTPGNVQQDIIKNAQLKKDEEDE